MVQGDAFLSNYIRSSTTTFRGISLILALMISSIILIVSYAIILK